MELSTWISTKLGLVLFDRFLFAEIASDWRGNNNLAESILAQMKLERFPVPSWIVVGAGTGGTSTTIGRYLNYHEVKYLFFF